MVCSVILLNSRSLSYCGEMNNAGDGDDQKANDDGSNSNIESVPAQSPGAFIVAAVVTVSRLRKRNHCKT